MNIGITGASGHVGANLIRLLQPTGHNIKVLSHKDTRALQVSGMEIVKGDVLKRETLTTFCTNLDVVFHLAAHISIGGNNYDTVYAINVDGTKNVMEAAKQAGVKRFIHFSSIHALEHYPFDFPMDETRPLALNAPLAYERTKAIAESLVLEQNNKDFETVVLNPTAIIGPNDFKPSFLGRTLIMMYKGQLPGLVPGGYNWVDVRDVAAAAISAIDKGKPGEHYILSGEWQSIKFLASLVAEIKGRKMKLPVLPLRLARAGIPFFTLWSRITGNPPLYTSESLSILQNGNRNISHNKATAELGFNPRPLKESLNDTISWFRKMSYI